jgi:hypothetical protein
VREGCGAFPTYGMSWVGFGYMERRLAPSRKDTALKISINTSARTYQHLDRCFNQCFGTISANTSARTYRRRHQGCILQRDLNQYLRHYQHQHQGWATKSKLHMYIQIQFGHEVPSDPVASSWFQRVAAPVTLSSQK